MPSEFLKKLSLISSYIKKNYIHLNLQLLNQCNFKCKICDFWKEASDVEHRLTVEHAEIISRKLKPLEPLIVTLGGGEPLLHNDLLEISRIIARNNFIVMISNGWLINQQKAKEIFQAGFYEVSVSIDYADPQKHDENRGKEGAFDRGISALKYLIENRSYPHQRVNMITTLMNDNLDDLEPLIQLSEKTGVTFMLSLYSQQRGEKPNSGYDKDVSAYLLKLKKRYKSFVTTRGYLSGFSDIINNPEGILPCYAGKHYLDIDYRGNVLKCIDAMDSPAGNIITDDWSDIHKNLHQQFKENTCGKCWTSCRGAVEALVYGKQKLISLYDNYHAVKDIPLN